MHGKRFIVAFFHSIFIVFAIVCFNGEMSGEVRREIFERGHAAVLLPYDPVRDEVVLIEQIRIAAWDSSETPWLLEMIAGMIEEGESIEDVARREAVEEAGLTVGRTKPVLSYLASPGGTSERLSILVGEVDATQAKGIHGLVEENEDIRVHVVSREQAYQCVEEGEHRQRGVGHRFAMAAAAL
ncbi:ADP-ribose pyrophosphatase [Cedecea neteri]|uniref:ADP-ribose pyrophosphatase n=1 Tax=Cedecea neteri TaxID=158822 RepID=A0A2X2T2T5_9ENTR|nr:ADP-ribose pyrophosphatase [Cedecea neteri]